LSWLHETSAEILGRIEEAKEAKAWPFFRPQENVGARVKVGNGSYVNFTSNDYLGLSRDPRVMKAGMKGILDYGTGLGSARPQATSVRHEELERRLASWLGYEACMTFTTGYQSLVGTLSAFLDDDVTLILDRLCHASIIEGMFLARGEHPDMEVRFFKHNRMKLLEKCLRTSEYDKKMVVAEGYYSVDGDMGPIDEMADLCRKYGAVLVVDDAHGLGALGPTGRGVGEIFGVQADILIGTFSKAFGGIGGFVCGDRDLIDYLMLTARAFMFSATLPVSQVEAAIAALDIIETEPQHLRRLHANGDFFRAGLQDLGYDLGDSQGHITPIYLRDEMLTMKFGAYLFHGGDIMMMPFISPGVPPGTERLRCNITASHTRSEMSYALEALAKIGPMLDVLPEGSATRANDLQRFAWLAQHKFRGVQNAGVPYLVNEVTEGAKKAVDYTRRIFNGARED
jgi:8-amino-7-oxononanoate synthase